MHSGTEMVSHFWWCG